MNDKKLLITNISAQLFSFVIGLAITFFLSPFVINKLGKEAYGFIGLANNFVNYTTLITIALNSMASRFITISFHKGDILSAKKYFSSVFYSNCILAFIIAILAIVIIGFLERIVEIPNDIVTDVKLLFSLTFINSIIALLTNIYSVSTFITNKLYLSSYRNIIGSTLRGIFLFIPFAIFSPHLWYYGISALTATTFVAYANKILTKRLTPALIVKKSLYDFKNVKELIHSGIWNVLSKLSDLLSTGLDLLIANIFISAAAMGTLSISKAVPTVLLALFASISAIFAPKLTEQYAKNDIYSMRKELINNIKIMGIFSSVPLIIFILFGEEFFKLWIPSQDSNSLYWLSTITVISMFFSMPQESLWNIFTITNKVKLSSFALLIVSIFTILTVIICMFEIKDDYHCLLALVFSRFFWGSLRSLFFLPIYGAKCLKLKWYTFYPILIKNLLYSASILAILYLLKPLYNIHNWPSFITATFVTSIFTFTLLSIMILPKYIKKIVTPKT